MAHQLELQLSTLKTLAHGIPTALDLRLAYTFMLANKNIKQQCEY